MAPLLIEPSNAPQAHTTPGGHVIASPHGSLYEIFPQELVHEIGFQLFVEENPLEPSTCFWSAREMASSTLATIAHSWYWRAWLRWKIYTSTPSPDRSRRCPKWGLAYTQFQIRACVAERKQAVEMSLGDGDSFTDIKGNDVLRNPREFGEWDLTAPLEWLVVASKMYCEANAVQPSRFDDRRHNPEKKADDILDDIDDDAEILHQYLHAIRARRATLKGAAAAHHGQCGNRKEPVKTLGLECVCRRLKCLKQQCLVCELLGKKGMDTDTRIPWFREELLSKNQPPKPAPQPVPHSEVNW